MDHSLAPPANSSTQPSVQQPSTSSGNNEFVTELAKLKGEDFRLTPQDAVHVAVSDQRLKKAIEQSLLERDRSATLPQVGVTNFSPTEYVRFHSQYDVVPELRNSANHTSVISHRVEAVKGKSESDLLVQLVNEFDNRVIAEHRVTLSESGNIGPINRRALRAKIASAVIKDNLTFEQRLNNIEAVDDRREYILSGSTTRSLTREEHQELNELKTAGYEITVSYGALKTIGESLGNSTLILPAAKLGIEQNMAVGERPLLFRGNVRQIAMEVIRLAPELTTSSDNEIGKVNGLPAKESYSDRYGNHIGVDRWGVSRSNGQLEYKERIAIFPPPPLNATPTDGTRTLRVDLSPIGLKDFSLGADQTTLPLLRVTNGRSIYSTLPAAEVYSRHDSKLREFTEVVRLQEERWGVSQQGIGRNILLVPGNSVKGVAPNSQVATMMVEEGGLDRNYLHIVAQHELAHLIYNHLALAENSAVREKHAEYTAAKRPDLLEFVSEYSLMNLPHNDLAGHAADSAHELFASLGSASSMPIEKLRSRLSTASTAQQKAFIDLLQAYQTDLLEGVNRGKISVAAPVLNEVATRLAVAKEF